MVGDLTVPLSLVVIGVQLGSLSFAAVRPGKAVIGVGILREADPRRCRDVECARAGRQRRRQALAGREPERRGLSSHLRC